MQQTSLDSKLLSKRCKKTWKDSNSHRNSRTKNQKNNIRSKFQENMLYNS